MRGSIMVACWLVASLAAADSRTVFVISDLHFGVGKVGDSNRWHAYEDFRWKDDLAKFLDAIDTDGKGSVDLVLNGDTFELWQSTQSSECPKQAASSDLGCSESHALIRLKRVMAAHSEELDLLKSFASRHENRVYLVPGNHDGALMLPKLASELGERMKGSRFEIVLSGRWISENGAIVAEHGHQIGKDVNAFSAWPKPFLVRNGVTHLQRSGGEEFVLDVYNPYELKYPIIDNITEEATGVGYAVAIEGAAGLATATGKFLRFLLVETSWPQRGSWLGGPGKPSEWDLPELRGEIKKRGATRVGELLRSDDPLREILKSSVGAPSLDDQDLRIMCDRAAAFVAADATQEGKVRPCPGTLGAMGESIFRTRNGPLSDYLEKVAVALKKQGKQGFRIFVFSHTHRSERPFQPLEEEGGGPYVVNTGAFQRVISPESLRDLQKARGLDNKGVLRLQPEDLPACYGVVRVAPDAGAKPELLSWRGSPGLSAPCP